MKRIIYLTSAAVIIGIFGYFIFIGSGAYNAETKPKTQSQPKKKAECCSSDVVAGEAFTENSILQLNSKWKNQFNNDIELKELKGKVQVVSMIFANCSYACPILVNDIKKIEKSLTSDVMKNVSFTLISIDPERDTPKRLKQFAQDQNLGFSKWQLLTGTRSDIDDFAALIGFRYKKENDGSFSHSNIITILNTEGEIIHQQVGLNEDVSETSAIITEEVNKGV